MGGIGHGTKDEDAVGGIIGLSDELVLRTLTGQFRVHTEEGASVWCSDGMRAAGSCHRPRRRGLQGLLCF